MNYWIDLFTGTTWKEFRQAGATVSGFRVRQTGILKRVKPGDILLCYLTGVMRWVGALEVTGVTDDNRRIWSDEEFPVRVAVKPLILLEPENGVPMLELEGRADFYRSAEDRGRFRGFLRSSLKQFVSADGELVLNLLRKAQEQPVSRPVDPKKLARKPLYRVEAEKGMTTNPTLVSVPDPEEAPPDGTAPDQVTGDTATTRHTEIQCELLRLGAELNLDVWVARNDRSRKWNGKALSEMPRLLDQLPTQFNEATTRTIELIDVLWLAGNSIVAAFEIECTTAIYSGLLRMGDLLALQPNLEINLFLVAPDERREKVEQELLRPTFSLREKPLATMCGFLPFTALCEQLRGIRKLGLAGSLKPSFLKATAEYFSGEDNSQET